MNRLLLFCAALISTLSSYAQPISDCGTLPDPEYDQYRAKYIKTKFYKQGDCDIQSVPIKAHIIRTSNGEGGLSETDLYAAVDALNESYKPANLQFFVCGDINYIDDDEFVEYEKVQEHDLASPNDEAGKVNLYFLPEIPGLCGYAYFPGSNQRVFMANSCVNNGSTLPHEMGHFFGLPHTHNDSNKEFVDGSNCSTAGDGFCDTPADPNLSGLVDFNCAYTGTEVDPKGEEYDPNTMNYMSYSRKSCRTEFSAEQIATIRDNSENHPFRSNWNCSQDLGVVFKYLVNQFEVVSNEAKLNLDLVNIGATASKCHTMAVMAYDNDTVFNSGELIAEISVPSLYTNDTFHVELDSIVCGLTLEDDKTYFLKLDLDINNVVPIAQEARDTILSPAFIPNCFLVDLVGAEVSVTMTSSVLSTSMKVANIGTQDLDSRAIVNIYASTDNIVNSSDIRIFSDTIYALDKDGGNLLLTHEADLCLDSILPDSIFPEGQYFYGYTIDEINEVEENFDVNNDGMLSDQSIGHGCGTPNLLFTEFLASINGNGFEFDLEFYNDGKVQAGAFSIKVYASEDDTLNQVNDLLFYSTTVDSLPSLTFGNVSDSIDMCVPNTLVNDYRIFVIIDAAEVIEEYDEVDNIVLLIDSIDVDCRKPDLHPTDGDILLGIRDVKIDVEVTNRDVISSGKFVVSYFASINPDFDTTSVVLGVDTIQNLDLGQSEAVSQTFNFCEIDLEKDNYYFGAFVDGLNDVVESNEINNVLVFEEERGVAGCLQSELFAESATISNQGNNLLVSDMYIKNEGADQTGYFLVGYYASTDGIIDASDILLDVSIVDNLQPGKVIRKTKSLHVCSEDLEEDETYNFGYFIDYQGLVNETNLSDNSLLYTNNVPYTIKCVTGVEEESIQVSWYPNPVENQLNLEGVSNITNITLADVAGKELAVDYGGLQQGEITLDLSHLDNGMYILKIEKSGGGIESIQFLKN